MLATSRNASSCLGPRSRASIYSLHDADRIEHQSRPPIGQQGDAGENRQCADCTVELFDEDLLTADQLVHRECSTPLAELGDYGRAFTSVLRAAHDRS